ncbi:MAG: SCP2 sterol-binding domain-containing protein [Pseudomonadota bacterium]
MAEIDIREFIFGMPSRFSPKHAEGLSATIQFLIEGDGGGSFVLSIEDGTCVAEERMEEAPSLQLKMSRKTYIDLAMGQLKGPQAFFTRKLRFRGDTKLLMKMHTMFPALKKEDIAQG